MRYLISLFLLFGVLFSDVAARSSKNIGTRKKLPERPHPKPIKPRTAPLAPREPYVEQTDRARKYKVNGKEIPDVPFDIGESYAGLMPISESKNASQLYFWYFPTDNPVGKDDVTIWLNGGPGCSSLEGLLQESGHFLWQWGTAGVSYNPWAFKNLTNIVFVEQPVGTGFSQGTPTATSEEEVAEQFLGFWKNFMDTFKLHNKHIYVVGESYAGYYVPYIADAMLNETNEKYFDVQGITIYDPVIGDDVFATQIPAVPFVDHWPHLFSLNETFMADIHARAESCGYTDYFNKYFTFPPVGKMDLPPQTGNDPGCDLWGDIYTAVSLINPCFSVYEISTTCPVLWDVLGFPGSFAYTPPGTEIFFNREEVQKAINAPIGLWEECSDGVLDIDTSDPSGISVLPRVIEKTNRTMIVHGNLDYVLLTNGTLMTIQNMTWNGVQGFTKRPSDPVYVPDTYWNQNYDYVPGLASTGTVGNTRTERGLTWVEISLSGHMIPQFAPSAAYRMMEYMLGRIDSLGVPSNATVERR
ncbi:alpha/beta-hydrolase [Eremomyces bilateralis CBS 781.70]|uniref:Carboxypeptidase n=1 Tax=Eremomyces bilateralis CBS 781.70 TaxID=1392243 RepID=A0A6G1G830_9PEZI|nr:alpha/beta-hydrolase [Eremomyces bilateralis CBS 781.70]KAF1814096.1 alpha/beta-hydrolase [Eremomyces bilateralis CBS 781.70]